jgi:UrcA family protein
MKMIRNALLAIAILSPGLAAAQVSAARVDQARSMIVKQARSMIVKYGDLDLSSPDGASVLYKRLMHAAREVCKMPDGGFGDPAMYLHCYHDALARGVRDLNNLQITALYNGKQKGGIGTATVTAALPE